MDSFFQFLIAIVYIVPFILLHAAGIVLSLINRRKMPKASVFALVGFCLLLISSLITLLYNAWLHFWLQSNNDTLVLSRVILIQSTLVTILGFIATIFLLAAIFVKRDYKTQT